MQYGGLTLSPEYILPEDMVYRVSIATSTDYIAVVVSNTDFTSYIIGFGLELKIKNPPNFNNTIKAIYDNVNQIIKIG